MVELRTTDASLVGDPISVRVTGLPPDVDVVLFSQLVDRSGRLWVSESTFRSSAEGTVDPARQTPIDDAWEGIDALGPFWSPLRKTKAGAHPEPADGHAERTAISALVDKRAVATAAVTRWYRSPEVEEVPVPDDTLAARMFVKRGDDRRSAVIVVPGSGGGVPAGTAEQLASHGHASLALGYFGEPQTVSELESVPLEYFDRAIEFLKAHPRVDPRRIAILGGSKGGELSLLLASRRDDIRAVVAAVPSSVVFQSIADGWPRTSSWSVDGEDLPFVPYVISNRFRESGRLSLLYEDSLENEDAVARATIPVDRIAGSILLVSGRDDWMWPATRMCDDIVARLKEAQFPHEVTHLAYDDVGHEVLTAGFRPVSWSRRVGGTRQGHAAAQADAWKRTLEFLARNLAAAN
ncbi:MAG: hypothetical protein HKO59_08380 [Phycisphaerales bacterium]|nr:acyl-CoA thioesterase/BAAT N-terminal domain-containing protein [Phycisphaerae bacterium]NNF44957.1 hypothetical protein [Phycisphaerales bacterium]NNM25986.1 hypothetical protein [Phycisphaerales bacterium]